MNNEKVLTIDKSKIAILTKLIALIGVATAIPFLHQQMITGPVVNATLFISTVIIGTEMGVLVGLIPSVIALSVGTLPAALAPMAPYIMISNTILIFTFNYFRKKNFWLAVASASFLKFIFLFATSAVVIDLILKKELATSVSAMMSYPQLLTALAGGILAYLFLRIYKKT